MSNTKRVVVAMSGGIDSSVAAAILVNQGYNVVGMMLRLWSEKGHESENRCCTPEAIELAKRTASHLNIPFYVIDVKDYFHQKVVNYFIDGYTKGTTPNPCLICNKWVRWDYLFNHALSFDASYFATGHYARLRYLDNGQVQLLKSIDPAKDQSYVLHVLDQKHLGQTIFPVGDYTKSAIRQKAIEFDLPVVDKPESQDLCFLGGENYRSFLIRNVAEPQQPGPIYNTKGEQIGLHQGIALYTIGQRKGLGISSQHPLYVIDKDLSRNALIVGLESELGRTSLRVKKINWVAGRPPKLPLRAQVKIRYRAEPSWATVARLGEAGVQIDFEEPKRDITTGQAAVIYDGDACLGGGIIS